MDKKDELLNIPIILKIDESTDVRVNLRQPRSYEAMVKVSNACKTRNWWLKSLFLGESRHYYKFLCLTNERLFAINAMFNKADRNWEARYENNFDITDKDLVSAYTNNVNGKDWLVVNHKYLGKSYQIKLPVENSKEWVKEITSVIDKAKSQS